MSDYNHCRICGYSIHPLQYTIEDKVVKGNWLHRGCYEAELEARSYDNRLTWWEKTAIAVAVAVLIATLWWFEL